MGLVVDFGDAASRSLWETRYDLEVRAKSPLLDPDAGLVGGPGSVVVQKDDLLKGGKQLTVNFMYQNKSRGKTNNQQLLGAEQGLDHAHAA